MCENGPTTPPVFLEKRKNSGWGGEEVHVVPCLWLGRGAENKGAGASFALERSRPVAPAGAQLHPNRGSSVLEGAPAGRRQVL